MISDVMWKTKKINYTEIEAKAVVTGKKTTGRKQEIYIRRYTVEDYKSNIYCGYS